MTGQVESAEGEPDMDVRAEMIELQGMPAQVARPGGDAKAPAVLVIQEAFGLNGHIKDVARRIAGEGYVTLAPDLYWRGGKNRSVGYDQLPEALGMMQSLKEPEVIADLRNA